MIVILNYSNTFINSLANTAPSPSSIMIMMPPSIIFAGHTFYISCTVNLPSTVDIPVTVNIAWSEPVQNYTSPALTMESPNEYSSIATFISDVQSELVGFYCIANVSSMSLFVTTSESEAANINIFVVGRPSQPTSLKIAYVNASIIAITWNASDNDIVYGYELEYDYHIRQCPDNTGMTKSINISNNINSYPLGDLEEDSEFNISLIAFNPAGESEPAIITATTSTSGTIKITISIRYSIFLCSANWSTSESKHY